MDNSHPREIKKLDLIVVNQIAAGEIIQGPANAIKELLENSLDAGSSFIQITIKEGGLKFFQIKDNGTGIRKNDLDIVCERFTTSKLHNFDDLKTISTFGFRGEALCSISHVAHLTIQTKTATDQFAYKAIYQDGKLKSQPTPCAGNQGTIITVEHLFYNFPQRRLGLQKPAEETKKISDVISKYAIHNSHVGFTFNKPGADASIKTQVNSSSADNIKMIYGGEIGRDLIDVDFEDEDLNFKLKGCITSPNYSGKKNCLLLFINHRLVECQTLQNAVKAVYENFLPKDGFPFCYLSLEILPSNVDVNIHPTKHEVRFLYEAEIAKKIQTHLEEKLTERNDFRVFYTQKKTFHPVEDLEEKKNKTANIYPKDYVRTDCRLQKLDKFLVSKNLAKLENIISISQTESICESSISGSQPETICESSISGSQPETICESSISGSQPETICESSISGSQPETICESNISGSEPETSTASKSKAIFDCSFPQATANSSRISNINPREIELTSILKMRKEIEDNCSMNVRTLIKEHVFIGVVDKISALIQYQTKLLICNTVELSFELFNQLLIYNFGNFNEMIKFNPPLSIKQLALIALDMDETEWTEDDGPKEKLAEKMNEILSSKCEMMQEYFGLRISNGNIETLPILLSNHKPDMCRLPIYLLRLATNVDWNNEVECFQGFFRETASFYSYISQAQFVSENYKWTIEHVLYPALKQFLIPNTSMKGFILEITNTSELYKVFERC